MKTLMEELKLIAMVKSELENRDVNIYKKNLSFYNYQDSNGKLKIEDFSKTELPSPKAKG